MDSGYGFITRDFIALANGYGLLTKCSARLQDGIHEITSCTGVLQYCCNFGGHRRFHGRGFKQIQELNHRVEHEVAAESVNKYRKDL